ncbi:MAG: hypothetical protein QM786_04265 [Breznakibacter sp.]|jgi:hypothetical protein
MAHKAQITIHNDSMLKAQKLETLLQSTINKVDHDDFIKLLQKVNEKPSVVKTALKYIHLA